MFSKCFIDDIKPIGGENHTIEINETLYSKSKYHQGRLLNQQWIFGGICRETNEIIAYLVPDRSSVTLMEIIEKNILPGTTIVSDSWSSYNSLDVLPYPQPYIHLKVNHKENFVDPATGANTQKVERLWRSLKTTKVRYNGIARHHICLHLAEFIWRYRNIKKRDESFEKTIELLKESKFVNSNSE